MNAGVNVVVGVLRHCHQDSTFRVYNSVNVITVLAFVMWFVLVACVICLFLARTRRSLRPSLVFRDMPCDFHGCNQVDVINRIHPVVWNH